MKAMINDDHVFYGENDIHLTTCMYCALIGYRPYEPGIVVKS